MDLHHHPNDGRIVPDCWRCNLTAAAPELLEHLKRFARPESKNPMEYLIHNREIFDLAVKEARKLIQRIDENRILIDVSRGDDTADFLESAHKVNSKGKCGVCGAEIEYMSNSNKSASGIYLCSMCLADEDTF